MLTGFRWLDPKGEKIEVKIKDEEEFLFGMEFWLFQDRKFRPFGRNFRGAEIPAYGRKFRP